MILFITRKYPPSRGGMEKLAHELSRQLSKITEIKLIKWGGSNNWLPLVLPYFFFRTLWTLLIADVQLIYLQDGLLSPLGLLLKAFTRKPIAITIHGRDIAYQNWLYQFVIPKCLKKLDRVVCVSEAIREACLDRGVDKDRTVIINNGISDEFHVDTDKEILRGKLADLLGKDLHEEKILLSAGRLIENKGIHWFVAEVITKLADMGCLYVVAGDGVFTPVIHKIIEEKNLENSVFMVGWADKEKLKLLYNAADIFIMPNVPGLMEGFGLVALEASSCGLPVVASALGGIKDAIRDGKNGFLIEPGNTQGFIEKIKELLKNDDLRERLKTQVRQFTLENFSWERMSEQYLHTFSELSSKDNIH